MSYKCLPAYMKNDFNLTSVYAVAKLLMILITRTESGDGLKPLHYPRLVLRRVRWNLIYPLLLVATKRSLAACLTIIQ